MYPSIDDRLDQAYGQLKEGHWENAIESFSECLLLGPGESRIYYGRGMAHFQLGKWATSILDFKRAIDIDPEDPENWIGLGMGLAMDSRIYEAVEVFENLLAEKPGYIRAHIQLAQLYYRLGVIGKGHAQLDAALAQRPALAERRQIEQLKKEQTTLDKRRYYRPDFEALRRQNQNSGGFLEKIKDLFSKKSVDK